MSQKAHSNSIDSTYKAMAIGLTRRQVHILCWSFVGIYALVAYSGLLGIVAAQWWTDAAWTIASLVAALKSLHTAFRQQKPNQRSAWLCYGLAALSWFVGMLIWDYHELVAGISVPFPSIADGFFMSFAPLFVMGTVFFRLEVPNARFTLIQLGNLGIILSAIAIVVVIILYIPISVSGQSAVFIGIVVAYPVMYALAFFFTLFCFWYYSWQNYHHVFGLLLGSLFLHAATVVLYSLELLDAAGVSAHWMRVSMQSIISMCTGWRLLFCNSWPPGNRIFSIRSNLMRQGRARKPGFGTCLMWKALCRPLHWVWY